ncbi:MAG TPA: hypothetical protein VL944_02715 [Candidatus Acidoferrum sp.]|nr:hypothetical protein [Candidatus Acidoferrum sp.]
MSMGAKRRGKPVVRADITPEESQQRISVMDMSSGILAFRADAITNVEISARAFHEMSEDLSGRRERLGFLLGHSERGGALFVRYVHSDIPLVNGEGELQYYRKDFIRELKRFRREGFDAQADMHNHPREEDYKIPIGHSARGLPAPFLLRHGLFDALEWVGGLSNYDRKDTKKNLRKMEKAGVAYRRSFTGVLTAFHVKHIEAPVKLLGIWECSSLDEPVGICVTERGE